ncbi:MAG: ABC transporter permease subunit [Planctomycetia bacterium]|nr:ABC transporter permease subunit [Planctomycetia bacterium]
MSRFIWVVFFVLWLPLFGAVWMSFTPGELARPPLLAWSVGWHVRFLSDPVWLNALATSVGVGVGAVAVAVATGVPAALARPKRLDRIIMLPLAIPPIVLGIGLLPTMHVLGIARTPLALIFAHGLLGMPLVYLSTRAALRAVPPELIDAARGLGASSRQAFVRVTLPLIAPGVMGGALLAFVLSFNEFFIAQFLGGPEIETLPRRVWPALRYSVSPVVASASVWALFVTFVGLFAFVRLAHKPFLIREHTTSSSADDANRPVS